MIFDERDMGTLTESCYRSKRLLPHDRSLPLIEQDHKLQ